MIRVLAPSNIALIKYMGKSNSELNLPENPSLSMTLNKLCTLVELEEIQNQSHDHEGFNILFDEVLPKYDRPLMKVCLNENTKKKVFSHAIRVHQKSKSIFEKSELQWKEPSSLRFRTGNTFPEASGIASSASSFAAMTCAFAAHVAQDKEKFLTLFSQDLEFKRSLSSLSRMGSGSSCRSFEGPFVHWESDQTLPICSELPPLVDLVLLISKEKKSVSSSLAHLKVKTSPLWSGRVDRVNVRISQMSEAMKLGNLPMISKIAWQEMFEMHSLFHTSEEPFTYWAPMSLDVLGYFKTFIEKGDNIIVTMDAGPNVHVLVPEKDQDLWLKRIVEKYPNLEILVDQQSKGIQFEI